MKKIYVELPIFATGEIMRIEVKKILYNKKSNFQKILIIDTEEFGKCLIIDGVMQVAESDHELYDEELLRMLQLSDKKILILGGGDGYVAKMALEKNPKINVVIVDLDIEVVKACRKQLNQEIFDNPRLNLHIVDIFNYFGSIIGGIDEKFDGIVCDLTDAPIGQKNKKDFENFYSDIISLSFKYMQKSGWISIQLGASKISPCYINTLGIIGRILKEYSRNISRSDIFIPSYGESCAFLYGKK